MVTAWADVDWVACPECNGPAVLAIDHPKAEEPSAALLCECDGSYPCHEDSAWEKSEPGELRCLACHHAFNALLRDREGELANPDAERAEMVMERHWPSRAEKVAVGEWWSKKRRSDKRKYQRALEGRW